MQKASKSNLLDQFYDHLDEADWLEGVDLYQAGRVNSIATYEGLISAKVLSMAQGSAEVRLKIHPAGHCIQWIECTCRKNRQHGYYCEHIAALMIHIDRERPELFASLDTTSPLKPPAGVKKPVKAKQSVERASTETKIKGSGAAQKILEHLKGSIHGVALLAHGPGIRVRIEIKEGHLTHYDLDLDAAARFLESHPNLNVASAEVRQLEVYDTPVELGTRIYQPEDEKIVAERVLALKIPKRAKSSEFSDLKINHEGGRYKRVTGATPEGEEDNYLFIPLKAANRYIGQDFAFIPGKGYWPLNRASTSSSWNDLPLSKSFKEDDAALFVKDNFTEYLRSAPIFLDEKLKNPVILEAPSLAEVAIIEEGDGWFRLDPRYGVGKDANGKGGVSISMVELMKQFRKKRRKYIRSGDAWIAIPDFVTQHNWQLDETGEAIKVDALGLMRIKAAVGDFDQFVGSKKMINHLRDRLEFDANEEEAVIHDSKISLRHYQEVGLQWLWWLYRNNLHGLLADEMGLGKTHQAMALMCAILKKKPDAKFLILCPTTVLDHWLDKMEEYAPALKPLKFHGPKRGDAVKELLNGRSTVLTSYGIMLRDIKQLSAQPWEAVILDEAHFVKNNDTATYQAACRLNSRMRICLTGTPMENHLGELKNIFDFLVPGYLGSDDYFRRNFLNPIGKSEKPETEIVLQKLIHPFKMRRTKELVLPDLPAKVEDLRHCSLSDEQVKLYRDIVAMKASPLVEQLQDETNPIPFLHVFATITMLKQVCDHPALLSGAGDYRKHESGKFELLKELLDEAIGSGHKIVIFSQYVSMITIIQSYLTEMKIGHVILTGQTRNRGEVIKTFQNDPDLKVFVGSLLAGGIGIDLTAANVVIHYDRWWNASKENQATDRVHRIGQNKNVQVLKLVTRGTLEEKIDRMIKSKQALFEKFLDKDEEIFKSLSRQELIDLLQ